MNVTDERLQCGQEVKQTYLRKTTRKAGERPWPECDISSYNCPSRMVLVSKVQGTNEVGRGAEEVLK